jgi:hypothetical protein
MDSFFVKAYTRNLPKTMMVAECFSKNDDYVSSELRTSKMERHVSFHLEDANYGNIAVNVMKSLHLLYDFKIYQIWRGNRRPLFSPR